MNTVNCTECLYKPLTQPVKQYHTINTRFLEPFLQASDFASGREALCLFSNFQTGEGVIDKSSLLADTRALFVVVRRALQRARVTCFLSFSNAPLLTCGGAADS